MFEKGKDAALSRKDRSKKGEIDHGIKPAIDIINRLEDFYTTSSCSGRIVLQKEPASARKKDFEWIYVSHSEPDIPEMKMMLADLPMETVWLRMEPFILHVCARDMESAERLMDVLRGAGLQHSGIMTTRKRIMLEATGNEHMDVPIARWKKLLISGSYLEFLAGQAGRKLAGNNKRLSGLIAMLGRLLK